MRTTTVGERPRWQDSKNPVTLALIALCAADPEDKVPYGMSLDEFWLYAGYALDSRTAGSVRQILEHSGARRAGPSYISHMTKPGRTLEQIALAESAVLEIGAMAAQIKEPGPDDMLPVRLARRLTAGEAYLVYPALANLSRIIVQAEINQ